MGIARTVILLGETRSMDGASYENNTKNVPILGTFITEDIDGIDEENFNEPSDVSMVIYVPKEYSLRRLALNAAPGSNVADNQRVRWLAVETANGHYKHYLYDNNRSTLVSGETNKVELYGIDPRVWLTNKPGFDNPVSQLSSYYNNNEDSDDYKKLVGKRIELLTALLAPISVYKNSTGLPVWKEQPAKNINPARVPSADETFFGIVRPDTIPGWDATVKITAPGKERPVKDVIDELLTNWGDYYIYPVDITTADGTNAPKFEWCIIALQPSLESGFYYDNQIVVGDSIEMSSRLTDRLHYSSDEEKYYYASSGTTTPASQTLRKVWLGIDEESYTVERKVKDVPKAIVKDPVPGINGTNGIDGYTPSTGGGYYPPISNPVVPIPEPQTEPQRWELVVRGSSIRLPFYNHSQYEKFETNKGIGAGTYVVVDLDNDDYELARLVLDENSTAEESTVEITFGNGGDHNIAIYEESRLGGLMTGACRFGWANAYNIGNSDITNIRSFKKIPFNAYLIQDDEDEDLTHFLCNSIIVGELYGSEDDYENKTRSSAIPTEWDFGGYEKIVKKFANDAFANLFGTAKVGYTYNYEYLNSLGDTRTIEQWCVQDVRIPNFTLLEEVGDNFFFRAFGGANKYWGNVSLPRFDAIKKAGNRAFFDTFNLSNFRNGSVSAPGTAIIGLITSPPSLTLPTLDNLEECGDEFFSYTFSGSILALDFALPALNKLEKIGLKFMRGTFEECTIATIVDYELNSNGEYEYVREDGEITILPKLESLNEVTMFANEEDPGTILTDAGLFTDMFRYSTLKSVVWDTDYEHWTDKPMGFQLFWATFEGAFIDKIWFPEMMNYTYAVDLEISHYDYAPFYRCMRDTDTLYADEIELKFPSFANMVTSPKNLFKAFLEGSKGVKNVICPDFPKLVTAGDNFMVSMFSGSSVEFSKTPSFSNTFTNMGNAFYQNMYSNTEQLQTVFAPTNKPTVTYLGGFVMAGMFFMSKIKELWTGDMNFNFESIAVVPDGFQAGMYRGADGFEGFIGQYAQEPKFSDYAFDPPLASSGYDIYRDKFFQSNINFSNATYVQENTKGKLVYPPYFRSRMGGTTFFSTLLWTDGSIVYADDTENGIPENFYDAT